MEAKCNNFTNDWMLTATRNKLLDLMFWSPSSRKLMRQIVPRLHNVVLLVGKCHSSGASAALPGGQVQCSTLTRQPHTHTHTHQVRGPYSIKVRSYDVVLRIPLCCARRRPLVAVFCGFSIRWWSWVGSMSLKLQTVTPFDRFR